MEKKEDSLAGILLRSSSITFLLIFIMRIFGYFFNSLLTKTVSQSDYGSYTFAWSIAMFASGIFLLGVNPAAARYVAYYRGKKDAENVSSVVKTGLITVSSLVFISLIFIVSINRLFPELLSLDRSLMLFMIGIFITHGIGFFFMSVISGYRKPEVSNVFLTLFTVMSFFFVLVFVYFGHGFRYILLSIFAAFLISNIGGVIYVLKYFGIGGKLNFELSKKLIVFGIPILLIDSANNLLSWANIYVLKFFHGFSEVGAFWAVTITSNVILMFSQPVITIFAPIVAEMYGRKEFEKLAFLASYIFERILLLSSPLLIIFLAFPAGILKIIFTEQYSNGAVPLQILSVSVFFLAISMIFRTVITASGKPQQEARIILIAAIINVILNILLVKPYGLLGASLAALASSLIILLFSFKYARRITMIIAYKDRLLKIGISLIISFLCVYAVKLSILNLKLAFTISFIVMYTSYVIILMALKTFRPEDTTILKMILTKLPLTKRYENKILNIFSKGIS